MVAPTKIQQLLGADKRWASRFEFHHMDIRNDVALLEELIMKSDTVVNLAAICNPSEYIKQPVNTINSNFTDAQVTESPAPKAQLNQRHGAAAATAAAATAAAAAVVVVIAAAAAMAVAAAVVHATACDVAVVALAAALASRNFTLIMQC